MLYVPKTVDYLKILTDHEVKDFLVINFGEYFKFTKRELYSKLNKKQNIKKVTESLYIFLTIPNAVEKHSDIDDPLKNYDKKKSTRKEWIFFLSGFSSQTLTIPRTVGKTRGLSFILLYHFHLLTNIETFVCNFACYMTIILILTILIES